MASSQITIRNVDPELSRRLRALSAERGESLNATVLRLLRDAVGVDARRERLERYATWSREDRVDFEKALERQRVVDERDWR